MYRAPLATYRLQFNAHFTFADAQRITPYLASLGISDVYASPILRARTGSMHGYDVVDATNLNPELGSEEDFTALSDALRQRDMGMVLDIVPNHMAASHENSWWMSVLENGPHSRFLHYFDIDWRPVVGQAGVETRVILPILGSPYGECLETQQIQLGFDSEGLFFTYYDKRLPLAVHSYQIVLRECLERLPGDGAASEIRDLVQNEVTNSRFLKDTLWRLYEQWPEFKGVLDEAIRRYNGRKGDDESFNALDALLDAQYYRLAYWRIASETINYRRFFDVTDLVGLRVENPEVFEARNRRILDLIVESKIRGLRIDHIDGLFDPVAYLSKVQLRAGEASVEDRQNLYVVVEKILARGEGLPKSFRVAGTTGYDFLDTVNALFVDSAGLRRLTQFYSEYTGLTKPFEEVVYERKKQVIDQLFSGEMRALGAHLGTLAVADRNARDFAPSELLAALVEITACMPVYRTYVREPEVGSADRSVLERVIAEARRRAAGAIDPRVFDFVELVLFVAPPSYIAGEHDKWLEFVMRWQQFTGRVMAKGVEDTAFYNYNRLISLNDVGGEPGRQDFDGVAELHARNETIARDWPHTMNATSTHDTKRSEDVRARIDVLSEMPEAWEREARRWTRMNAPFRQGAVPDPNEELLIYQTLLGMWPLDDEETKDVPARLWQYLEKAAREAKTHTSWLSINGEYEASLKAFAEAMLQNGEFLESFRPFHRKIAFHGALNSLSQVVLKICSPGIPDFYQGTELWDFTLVDPDNRRPVDYARRMKALQKLPSIATLLREWKDGRVKLFVTARALAARAQHAETFTNGAYRAVDTGTPNAVAFTRGEDEVLVVVPRLTTRLVKLGQFPVGDVWPERPLLAGRWRNVFTGETTEGASLRSALATFPVAILERME